MKTVNSNAWDPEHYKKFAKQAERGLVEIKAILLKGNEQILDVGCGDGRISAALAARVPQGTVIGLDVSERMIESAKKTYINVSNLSFLCEDITKYHKSDSFDMVTSFASFHWINDQTKALQNIHASLKTGGKLFIDMAPRENGPVSQTLSSQRWSSRIKNQQETFFGLTADKLKFLLEKAGFSEIIVYYKYNNVVFSSQQEFIDQLLTWLPYSTGLSVEEARECAQDIVAHTEKLEDGRFGYSANRLHAEATK